MDFVCKSVATFNRALVVVVEVVYVHIAITETPPWCYVEITDNLVHPQASFYAAALSPLFIQPLSIVFALTLFNILPSTESP